MSGELPSNPQNQQALARIGTVKMTAEELERARQQAGQEPLEPELSGDKPAVGKGNEEPRRSRLENEFLPEYLEILERPPSSVARYFGFSIVVLCILVVTWAYIGRIDIIASAPGRLIIDEKSKVIQAPQQGEVTHLHVKDGMRVKQGDLLIELNPISTLAERNRLQSQVLTARLEIARINALLSGLPAKAFLAPEGVEQHRVYETRAQMIADFNNYNAQIAVLLSQIKQLKKRQKVSELVLAEINQLVENARQRLDARAELLKNGYLPALEYLDLEGQIMERKHQRAELIATNVQYEAEQENTKKEIKRIKAEIVKNLYDALFQSKNTLMDASQQLVQAEEQSRMMKITAPVTGVVQQLSISTIGAVIQPAQELMVIVPELANLEAEIKVLNKDVGFLHDEQLVEVKIDSFPYTKYGTIKGIVLNVSRDSINDEQLGLVYPARIKLLSQAMVVGDKRVKLSAGMSVTAEIKTGDRRVIDYVLSPLKEYQSESLRER